jgi:hypothetical protein
MKSRDKKVLDSIVLLGNEKRMKNERKKRKKGQNS